MKITANKVLFTGLAIAAAMLVGCGKQEDAQRQREAEIRSQHLSNSDAANKVQEGLEQSRAIAIENVKLSLAQYFAANPRFDNTWKIVYHTDDYINPTCPQGSGWAWASIMRADPTNPKNFEKYKAWCSTSSASIGCFLEADMVKGPYAQQTTQCNTSIGLPKKFAQ